MNKKKNNNPRETISWDEYYMEMAEIIAKKSKDPNTQVGACIVDQNNKLISTGYNGMPRFGKDTDFPWNKPLDNSHNDINSKYWYVCHAEFNAILNAPVRKELEGGKVYVTLFPCNECAKAIIQSGIKEVIYKEDKYPTTTPVITAKILFDKCGIKIRQFITGYNNGKK